MLTTITPYWGRRQMLKVWLRTLQACHHPDVQHLVLIVGEPVMSEYRIPNVHFVQCEKPQKALSIGHYHNVGAQLANTEWIMKLDVDALPNLEYFSHLLAVLSSAKEREWFNGGMLYINASGSSNLLCSPKYTASMAPYWEITKNICYYSSVSYHQPSASNFICRKEDYLKLGGCSSEFIGWGWEDYQQIFMLEVYQRGANPLPGLVTFDNVTQRCRDELSRPKARELYQRYPALALLHCWHSPSKDPTYKTIKNTRNNRQVLLDYILAYDTERSIPN